MDDSTARHLIELDNRFYREVAESFSATRSAPWEGWRRVADILQRRLAGAAGGLSVLDVACGNMRLAGYLAESLPGIRLSYHGVDACDELVPAGGAEVPDGLGIAFTHADILHELMEGRDPLPAGAFDAVCCFGFMHHIPGFELRRRALAGMLGHLRPGGIACASFWRFMDDERLAKKAAAADGLAREKAPWRGFDPARLDRGDHLLGWQDTRCLRFCHHADEAELDRLAGALAACGAREVCRFSADGRSGALNRYLVLARC